MPGVWTPDPHSALAQAVFAAGFLYDPDQDIIYSTHGRAAAAASATPTATTPPRSR